MKRFFIEVKSEKDINDIVISQELEGKKVGLVSSIQYVHLLKKLQNKIPNSIIAGQVLGCNASKALMIKEDVDCYLYIGEGRFHPIRIARDTKKPVYIATGDKITEQEIKQMEKIKQAKQIKFLQSKKVGILITIKPGQKFANFEAIKNRIDKKCYFIVDDTFDLNQLENFSDIDMFVNTGCPRLSGKGIIAAEDLPKL